MGLAELFSFGRSSTTSDELPEIFPVSVTQSDFVKADVVTIFSKILTDVLERTQGLSDDQVQLMWDNCVKSSKSDGLVTLLARAMAEKQDLFLVYEKAVGVIREATPEERQKIETDYKTSAKSATGVFVSFKNFTRSDMVKLYVGLEYCTIAALHKSMNLSKATQLKMSKLRSSVALDDVAEVKTQAVAIARALAAGKDVMIDSEDEIANSVPDLTAVKSSIEFVMQKLAFYLGMPSSYLSGEQTGGLGTTGEGDQKAVERGLKGYYFAVMKPVLEAIFGVTLSYKSQDFRQIAGSMEVIKTFALVDEDLISTENKQRIINSLLDLPEDSVGDVDPEAGAPGGKDIQAQALNGAQVTSLIAIVQGVAEGNLPRDSAAEMIKLAFQVDDAQAEALLASAGKSFKIAKPAPAPAPGAAPKKPEVQ